MVFSEDAWVKISCILHLQRLGYRYLSLKDAVWDIDTNIFPAIFNEAIARINPELSADDAACWPMSNYCWITKILAKPSMTDSSRARESA